MSDLKLLRFFFFNLYMLGSLTELIAYASCCWVSCQWLVSKLTFIMKVINGNCPSYYSGNLLIAETCEYHKGCGGQWLIMDGICWMMMSSAENAFSGLSIFVSSFPNLEGTKSGGERSRAEAVPPSQTCKKRGGEGAGILSLPFIPPPLSQLAGLGGGCFSPSSFSAHYLSFWGKGALLQTWGQKGDFHFSQWLKQSPDSLSLKPDK